MQGALQILREADRGQLLDDFDLALADIANAIEKNGGGTGTIKITVAIEAKAEGAYQVSTKLDVKIPQPPRLPGLLFREEDSGEFTRRDPRQPELPSVVDADFKNRRPERGQQE